jgi:hypothetical protein
MGILQIPVKKMIRHGQQSKAGDNQRIQFGGKESLIGANGNL